MNFSHHHLLFGIILSARSKFRMNTHLHLPETGVSLPHLVQFKLYFYLYIVLTSLTFPSASLKISFLPNNQEAHIMPRLRIHLVSEAEQQLLDQALQKLCSRLFLTEPQKTAVLDILQTNLASGRIYRCFNGHALDQAQVFFEAYVFSVADHYQQETPRLLSLQRGEAAAWLQLSDWLTRCAYVKLKQIASFNSLPDHNASDFAQQVSLWLLNHFPKRDGCLHDDLVSPVGQAIGYTYDVPFSDWIAKVQSRRIVDAARKSARHSSISLDIDTEWIASEEVWEHTTEAMLLEQQISKLTLHQQQVIELYATGFDTPEVAARLGCTKRAVYNCRHAAIHRLRDELNRC
jgi:RNA polymerase sigma factor (sigma-70 family)